MVDDVVTNQTICTFNERVQFKQRFSQFAATSLPTKGPRTIYPDRTNRAYIRLSFQVDRDHSRVRTLCEPLSKGSCIVPVSGCHRSSVEEKGDFIADFALKNDAFLAFFAPQQIQSSSDVQRTHVDS